MAAILRRSVPSTTRRHYMVLNYFLMVINNLIFVTSLAIVGLSGNLLYWTAETNKSNILYLLNSTVLSESSPLPSPEISEYPAGFRLWGTGLVMAAGITTMIIAVITLVLVYTWSLQPTKYGLLTPNYASRFTLITLISFTTTLLVIATLVLSWSEYFNTPPLIFNTQTMNSTTYSLKTQTPESWLQRLSHSVISAPDQTNLRTLYILAATGRILIAPLLGFQSIAFIALLILRERMKIGARPRVQMEKLRESLLELAYKPHESGMDLNVETERAVESYADLAAQYLRVVQEVAEQTRVWAMDAFGTYEPAHVEVADDGVVSPITREGTRKHTWSVEEEEQPRRDIGSRYTYSADTRQGGEDTALVETDIVEQYGGAFAFSDVTVI